MTATRPLAAIVAVAWALGAALAQPLPRDKPEEAAPSASTCRSDLEARGVLVSAADVLAATGQCEVADPVLLEAVATPTGTVRFPSRPILDCRFAAVVAAWIREMVNPLAIGLFGAPVAAVATGPGYQCRRRSGGPEAKLSEHARGNAIDIAGVRLADKRTITVEALGRGNSDSATFMRAIATGACGYFTTVLGPGSDPDHATHLHVDRAERAVAEFRICMAR